jgi:hypothetical protein
MDQTLEKLFGKSIERLIPLVATTLLRFLALMCADAMHRLAPSLVELHSRLVRESRGSVLEIESRLHYVLLLFYTRIDVQLINGARITEYGTGKKLKQKTAIERRVSGGGFTD